MDLHSSFSLVMASDHVVGVTTVSFLALICRRVLLKDSGQECPYSLLKSSKYLVKMALLGAVPANWSQDRCCHIAGALQEDGAMRLEQQGV